MPSSTVSPAATPTGKDLDVLKFRSAIIDMDAFSQSGFSKISAIARLALAALEAPPHPRQDEDIANALTAIWSIADDIENCINARAEDVNANYIDDGFARRRAATARPDGGGPSSLADDRFPSARGGLYNRSHELSSTVEVSLTVLRSYRTQQLKLKKDLDSHLSPCFYWWASRESNTAPTDYESVILDAWP